MRIRTGANFAVVFSRNANLIPRKTNTSVVYFISLKDL
jgi:hypothetical protein